MYFVKKWGEVRGFPSAFNTASEKFECAPKCRALRIRNTGDEIVTLEINGAVENLQVGDNLTLGGYPDSMRSDVISFTFAGGGSDPKLIIIQDIQQKEPILVGEFGNFIDKCSEAWKILKG